jgi:hypothetical protein
MQENDIQSTYTKINPLEADILSFITSRNSATLKEISENVKASEQAVTTVLDYLSNTHKISIKNDKISLQTPPSKDKIHILKGNLLLPVTVIRRDDCVYITRGQWYKMPKDFDPRNVIWDAALHNNGTDKNASLVDMLTSHNILKIEKKNRHQLAEYTQLVNKIIPYNDTIRLHILKVCEDTTDILITIAVNLTDKLNSISVINRNFKISSEISTAEMLHEIEKPRDERNFENIKLSSIVEIRDIILQNNEIPISYEGDKSMLRGEVLNYVKIRKIQKGITFDLMTRNITGKEQVIESYNYDSSVEGIEAVINMCKPFLEKLLSRNNFILEL